MTQTFEEFKNSWNLTLEEAQYRMYELEKERDIFWDKAQIAEIALAELEEIFACEDEREIQVKEVLSRYHLRKIKNKRNQGS